MIAALLLAAAVNPTLDDIAIGDDLKATAVAHHALVTWTAIGPAFSWRREGGGTIMISGGASGKIEVVDFSPDRGETDAISLPKVGDFDLRATHPTLVSALGTDPMDTCRPMYMDGVCEGYAIPGGTEMVVQFEGPGDGPLRRVTWATHDTLVKLRLFQLPVSPTQ